MPLLATELGKDVAAIGENHHRFESVDLPRREERSADGVHEGGEGELHAAGAGVRAPRPVLCVDPHETGASIPRVALGLDLTHAVIGELAEQATAGVGHLLTPATDRRAALTEVGRALTNLVTCELRQRPPPSVEIGTIRGELLVTAREYLYHRAVFVAQRVSACR